MNQPAVRKTVSVGSHLRRPLRSSVLIFPKFSRSEVDKQGSTRLKKILINDRCRQAEKGCQAMLNELEYDTEFKAFFTDSPDERQSFQRSSSGAGPSSSCAEPSSSSANIESKSPSTKLLKLRAKKVPLSASPVPKVSGDGSRPSRKIYLDVSPARVI